jgi:hypothetical protein
VTLPDPRIETQPVGIGARTGETRTFSVTAAGSAPFTYQWRKDGQPIPGATAAELTLSNIQMADAGTYSVLVTNARGSIASADVALTVLPGGSGPLAHWTFDDDARDLVGSMHGELMGGATIANGRLVLNGTDAFLRTAPLPLDVGPKTLVARVSVSPLSQQGGGVLTLQDNAGEIFDSIVYAEREVNRWVPGSEGWQRTQDVGGTDETEEGAPVWIAIVYGADNSITTYRNGQPYGASYTPGNGLVQYRAGQAHVVMGLRHGTAPTGNRVFSGEIDEAMLYDRALAPEEIAGLAGAAVPRLNAARSANSLTISWPAEFAEYVLESSDRLPAAEWTAVGGAANNQVTVNLDESARFFRLRRP